MRIFHAFVYFLLLVSISQVHAQFPGCPDVNAGPNQTLTCNQACATINATAFQAGSTTNYSVSQIPHTPPIAYNEPGWTAISVGTDDVWSPIINLPFTFCYYGQSYTTCKVSSNGSITLGPATDGGGNPWAFTVDAPNPALVNAGMIFGVYHDIDPSVFAQGINWYILGQAPCRIFAV